MTIQVFVSELTVQALHKRVLGRLARLDKAQAYSGFLAPEEHGLAGELGALITDDLFGLTTRLTELTRESGDLMPADWYRYQLPNNFRGEVIHHIQHPESPSAKEQI